MANHKYELPTEWAPPLPRIDKSRAINKDMLVDRSLEFQEPICWPHDLQFIMLPHKPTNRRPASPHPEESRVDVGRKVMTLLDNARNRREITNRIAIEPPAVRERMDDRAARHAQFSEFKHSILSVGEIVLPARKVHRAAYVAIEPPLAPEHEFGQNLRDAIDRVMDEPVGMNYYDPIILTSTPAIDVPVVAVDEMHGIKRVQFSQMNRSMVLPYPSIDRSAYDAITSPPMPGREFEQNYMDCIDISQPSWMNYLNPPTRTPAIDIPVGAENAMGGRRHAQYSEFGRSILSVARSCFLRRMLITAFPTPPSSHR
ncbi:hypothetical protein DFH11DRAFT_1119180 [Phellopilus nigrolimitatus]|nr:hypothetical protein DFH11DRAFT_1119180 [Phellopilus nigrolimitatus]